jgi:hypothetical protein
MATQSGIKPYEPGNIITDKYWNFVATPLLFSVIGFGLYVLFTTDDIQLVPKEEIIEETRRVQAAPRIAAAVPPAAVGVAPRG